MTVKILMLLILIMNVCSISETNQSKTIYGLTNNSFVKFDLLFTFLRNITLTKNLNLLLTIDNTFIRFTKLSTAICFPLCQIKGKQFIFKGPLQLEQIKISLKSVNINLTNSFLQASYSILDDNKMIHRDNISGKIMRIKDSKNCQLKFISELNDLGQYSNLSFTIFQKIQNGQIIINFSEIRNSNQLFSNQKLNCSIITLTQFFNQSCQLKNNLIQIVSNQILHLHNFTLVILGKIQKSIKQQLSKIKVEIINDFTKIKFQCFANKQINLNNVFKVSQTTPNCTLSIALNAPDQYYFSSLQNLTATISWPQNVTNQQNYTLTFAQLYQLPVTNVSSSCNVSNITNATCVVQYYYQSQTYILTAVVTIPVSIASLDLIQIVIFNVVSPWQYDDPTYFSFDGCNNTFPFALTCTQPCQTCKSQSLPTQCTSCYPGNFTYQNQCSNSCISTFYANTTTGNCQECVSPCATCVNSTYCNTCLPSFYFYYNNCSVSCPTGSYAPQSSQYCQTCPQQCSVCSSNTNCTVCISPAFYYNYTCVYGCPYGTYQNGNLTQCNLCFALCQQCTNASIYCYNEQCIDGFYSFDGYCLQCPLSCATCSQYQQCTSCQNVNGIILNNSKCVSLCNEGEYFDGYVCNTCPQGCAYCIDSNNCTSCLSSFYQNNGTCSSCDSSCSICFSSSICLFCAEGGNWNNYQCQGCIAGYALDTNNICVPSLTGTVIPLPYTIISLILLLISLTSYFIQKRTLAFIMFFSLNSIVETAAVITFIVLVISDKYLSQQKYNAILTCIFCGLGFDLLNKIGQIFGIKKLQSSIYYQKWVQQYKTTKIILTIVSFFGLRFFYLQFSKAFGSPQFSAYLQKIQYFFLMKGVLISSLLTSILVISGCALQMQYPHFKSMYYAPFAISIDCLIVTILGAVSLSVFLVKTDLIVQEQFIDLNTSKTVTVEQSPRLSQMKTVQRPLQPNVSQS